jgi:hypothetical protein
MTLAKNWLAMVWNDARPRSTAPAYVPPWFAMVTALAVFLAGLAQPAAAERIANTTAVFAALDKVTARISKLEIGLGLTQKFGALKVTPRVCFSRPATERPKTTAFVEIDEINLDGSTKRIFAGWMFAENPGLNAVEHPVFDIWLTSCAKPHRPVARTRPDSDPPPRRRRRRVRR